MKDEIRVIENMLPESFCDELITKYQKKNEVDRTNRTHWGEDIIDYSMIVLVNDLEEYERTRLLTWVNNYLNFPVSSSAMFYRWTFNSYIPPHADGHVKTALTIHLNKDYHPKEGGIFLYQDKWGSRDWIGVEPRYNLGVFVTGDVHHAVTPVTSNRDRLSIQLFSESY
jgi:hypothetical protein